MIELKTPKEIEEMKPAGRFVGGILRDLKEFTKVGTNLLEIDEFVHKRIVDRKGAETATSTTSWILAPARSHTTFAFP